MRFLSQEWLEARLELDRDLPERSGASARVQLVVSGGPGGEVKHHVLVEDGRLREAGLGIDADAAVTVTAGYDVAVLVARGELDLNAAFMQGRVKVTGDMGQFLAVLPLTQSDAYRVGAERLVDRTEF